MEIDANRSTRHRSLHAQVLCTLLTLALLLGLAPAAFAASTPSVAGSGAIVVDFQTDEVYYEKNADIARPAASMTKVMSVYLVLEEVSAGRLSLDSYVTASSYAASISNNSAYSGLEKLKAGKSYQVDTLLRLIMTASCNGSVIVLAEHIGGTEAAFVQRMNDTAAAWGIDAHFADCCGFVDAGNAVTPRAMAYIAKRIISDHPEILTYSSLPSTTFQGKTFTSTNTLLRNGTCEGIDGLKSGTTDGAGYCYTGTAIRNGRRVISVVMNSTSYTARMNDTKKLLEYGFTCRNARETAWASAQKNLAVAITADTESLLPYQETTLTASFSGISDQIPCDLTWEVNGEVVQTQANFLVRDGAIAQLAYTPSLGEESFSATLTVTLPNGAQISQASPESLTMGTLSLSGRLGITKIEMYQETEVIIPLQLRFAQELSAAIPVGWYLDGEPIPYYQNDAFQLAPEGHSSYVLQGENLTPGLHVLEFRCNPQGLAGVEPLNLSVEVVVLADQSVIQQAA
jgi:D-alanyl-D-alanine carboxypeptidase